MLVVVDAHRRLVDVGLERVVVVGEIRDVVSHRMGHTTGRLAQPRDAPLDLPAPDREAAPRRRRGAVAQAPRARGHDPPARAPGCGRTCPPAGACTASVEQIIREEMDAIGGQEMLMPVLQPAEIWQRTGRYGIDELFKLKDRKGADLVLGHDPRGRPDLAHVPDAALLQGAAADPLPPADQGARRAPPARRPAAHPRVHHEGLVLLRPRPRGPRGQLREALRRLRAHLRPRRAAVVRGRVRRRDDGRHRRARVHGAVPRGGERRRARARLRGQRRGRHAPTRSPSTLPAPLGRARGGPHARRHHRRPGRRRARRPRRRAAEGLSPS